MAGLDLFLEDASHTAPLTAAALAWGSCTESPESPLQGSMKEAARLWGELGCWSALLALCNTPRVGVGSWEHGGKAGARQVDCPCCTVEEPEIHKDPGRLRRHIPEGPAWLGWRM